MGSCRFSIWRTYFAKSFLVASILVWKLKQGTQKIPKVSTPFLRFVQRTIVQNANAPVLSNASSLGSCCKDSGFPFWRTSLDEGLRQQKLWRHWVSMFLLPSKLGVRLREADHFHLFSMEEMQSILCINLESYQICMRFYLGHSTFGFMSGWTRSFFYMDQHKGHERVIWYHFQ